MYANATLHRATKAWILFALMGITYSTSIKAQNNLQVLGDLVVESNSTVMGRSGFGAPSGESRVHITDALTNDDSAALDIGFGNAADAIQGHGIRVSADPLAVNGVQIGLTANGSIDAGVQQGTLTTEVAHTRNVDQEAQLLAMVGQSQPDSLSNQSEGNISMGVGGYFEAHPSNSLSLDGQGAYLVGGVYTELAGTVDGDPGSGAIAALIAVDENQGTAPSYAGYFKGRGYFTDAVGIGVENPTAELDVQGVGQFESIRLTDPQGDIPMGTFTNSPLL